MNARFYMANLGIFGQHDPMSASTLDPYGYAYNNPIMFADPTGLEGEPIPGGSGPGGPQAIGTATNPVDVGEIVLTGQKSMMNKILTNPSIHSLTYGLGLTNEMPKNAVKYNPNPINVGCGQCNDGPIRYIGGAGDPLGIFDIGGQLLSNMESEDQEAALGLAAIAVILTQGRAAPGIIKAETSIARTEMKVLSRTEMSNIWGQDL